MSGRHEDTEADPRFPTKRHSYGKRSAEQTADAAANREPEAEADPWYGYYGYYRPYGYGYFGYYNPYGYGYYYGKRSADAEPTAEGEADPRGYYHHSYGYGPGYGYGYGYGLGNGFGYYGKRS